MELAKTEIWKPLDPEIEAILRNPPDGPGLPMTPRREALLARGRARLKEIGDEVHLSEELGLREKPKWAEGPKEDRW